MSFAYWYHSVNGISYGLDHNVIPLSGVHCIESIWLWWVEEISAYWYHSVNGIRYGMAQCDPIKRHTLYQKNEKWKMKNEKWKHSMSPGDVFDFPIVNSGFFHLRQRSACLIVFSTFFARCLSKSIFLISFFFFYISFHFQLKVFLFPKREVRDLNLIL